MDAKSTLRKATQGIGKALAPDLADGTDILKTLKKEHEEVKSLLKDLQDSDVAMSARRLSARSSSPSCLIPRLRKRWSMTR